MSENNAMANFFGGYGDGSSLLFFFLLLVLLYGGAGRGFGQEVGAEGFYGGFSWIWIIILILLFSGRRWY